MKSFKGIVKGNTIVLTERTDLPDNTEALVFIQPLAEGESITKEQPEILERGFDMGGITYKRNSMKENDEFLVDTNILFMPMTLLKERSIQRQKK
jgi:hypothetical protein